MKKISEHVGYDIEIRNEFNKAANDLNSELSNFGPGNNPNLQVAREILQEIFGIAPLDNDDIKNIKEEKIKILTIEMQGALRTLLALKKLGFIKKK